MASGHGSYVVLHHGNDMASHHGYNRASCHWNDMTSPRKKYVASRHENDMASHNENDVASRHWNYMASCHGSDMASRPFKTSKNYTKTRFYLFSPPYWLNKWEILALRWNLIPNCCLVKFSYYFINFYLNSWFSDILSSLTSSPASAAGDPWEGMSSHTVSLSSSVSSIMWPSSSPSSPSHSYTYFLREVFLACDLHTELQVQININLCKHLWLLLFAMSEKIKKIKFSYFLFSPWLVEGQ